MTGLQINLLTILQTNLADWFLMAEGQFILLGIADETMRNYHVAPCLPEPTINLLVDFMEGQLPGDLTSS